MSHFSMYARAWAWVLISIAYYSVVTPLSWIYQICKWLAIMMSKLINGLALMTTLVSVGVGVGMLCSWMFINFTDPYEHKLMTLLFFSSLASSVGAYMAREMLAAEYSYVKGQWYLTSTTAWRDAFGDRSTLSLWWVYVKGSLWEQDVLNLAQTAKRTWYRRFGWKIQKGDTPV